MKKLLVTALMGLMIVPTGAQAARRDRTDPRVRFTTQNNTILVGTGIENDVLGNIRGTATDAGSGISSVSVWAMPCNTTLSSNACGGVGTTIHRMGRVKLTCGSGRKSCTWSAQVPLAPGWYWLTVSGKDRAGNYDYDGFLQILVV